MGALKKTFSIFLSFILLIFFSKITLAQTQGLKIGVIDIKRVINVSKYGQEVMEKLQKKYEELQAKLEEKGKEVEALRDEIEKKSQLWSQEVREKKQAEYQKKLRELKALQEDAQFEMQEYERKLLDPVFKELEVVIKEYVENEKFDLILEKTQPGIYYASPRIDLSPIIIDLFNKHYEEKVSKQAPKQSQTPSTPTPKKEGTKK